MIIGLGSDIIDIKRIKKIIEKKGDKFISKNFTEYEIYKAEERFGDDNEKGKIAYYAKRFAAKEAFSKATGKGIGAGGRYCEIGVEVDDLRKPYLVLSGFARQTLDKLAPKGKKAICHLSLSDSKKMASATVIISLEDN